MIFSLLANMTGAACFPWSRRNGLPLRRLESESSSLRFSAASGADQGNPIHRPGQIRLFGPSSSANLEDRREVFLWKNLLRRLRNRKYLICFQSNAMSYPKKLLTVI